MSTHQYTDVTLQDVCCIVNDESNQIDTISSVKYIKRIFDADNQQIPITRVICTGSTVFDYIVNALDVVRGFISRYDPLVFPTVGASYNAKKNDVSDEDNVILPLDDVNKSTDVLFLGKHSNISEALIENAIKSEWPKVIEYYEKYESKYPALKKLARDKLKDEIHKRFNLDIDPDKACFIHFTNTMYYGHEKIHFPPVSVNKTLTEWLFSNFGRSVQDNMQDMDAMCGIYLDFSLDKKEYHASEEVKIKPTKFIDLVWEIDFYKYAKSKINEKYENEKEQVKKITIDFLLNISTCDLAHEHKKNIIEYILGLKSHDFSISSFNIGDYQASNAFLFEYNRSGSIIVYFPNSDFKFKFFLNDVDMRFWVASISKDKLCRGMIASHFKIEKTQDGLIKDGVITLLNSASQHSKGYKDISVQKTNIPSEAFFNLFAINMKDKELSDLDCLVKSDSEVRRDIWEDIIDSVTINIPNPVSPFLSLAMHIEHAFDADSFEEKNSEWKKIGYDFINIISFVLIDKVLGKVTLVENYPINELEEMQRMHYEVIDNENIANGNINNCHRVARGIVSTKICGRVSDIDEVLYSEVSSLSNSGDEFINVKLPKLDNPPIWYERINIINKDVTAEGIIFVNPSRPDRIIKFYKKEHSEMKANNNASIFRKLYSGAVVDVIPLRDEFGRNFIAVDMPKISGSTLADIRNEKNILKAIIISKEFIKKDPIAILVANLQDLNINIKDFNVGNIIFDSTEKKFYLIDFDYADASFIVNDLHYKTMYNSLYTKIKQDFLTLEWDGESDKKYYFLSRAMKRMNNRLTALSMDGKKARVDGFRNSIEKYNRETNRYVSWPLKRWVDNNMLRSNVDINELSFPDHMGIRKDRFSNSYIKINNKFFKVEGDNGKFFMKNWKEDKLFIKYKNGLFHPDNITTYGGMLSSTLEQEYITRAINSNSGLTLNKDLILNKSWVLSRVKVKSYNVITEISIGSRVDVTLTLNCKKTSKKFIDMPNLQWNENISFKKNNNKWIREVDMFNRNPNSRSFFPWVNRYIEAYHYAKASNKAKFNGNVKIYKNDFGMISPDEIEYASSRDEMIRNVQNYLLKNGGVIEITLTDLPKLIRARHITSAERVVGFNVAFDNKSVLKFYQGISLPTDNTGTVFISISDDIKLALGTANVPPPRRVTEPRVKRALQDRLA